MSRILLLLTAYFLFLSAYGQEVTKKDILKYGISAITYIDTPGNFKRVEICNDKGDIIRSTHTYNDQVNEYINEFQYNDSNQLVRMIHFSDGKRVYSSTYHYTKDLVTLVETINTANQMSTKTIEYDSKGNKSKEVYGVNGFPPYKTVHFTYNDKNLLSRETSSATEHRNQRKTEITYTYNSKDQLIKTERKFSPSEVATTIQVYNDKGHMIERTDTDIKGHSTTFTYTYDSLGLLATMSWTVPVKEKAQGLQYTSRVIYSFGPARKTERMLYVVDSIPVLKDPDASNPISKEDWADMRVLRYRDSIRLLGWEEVDAITFIFTKAYRNRPDSLKRVPSHRQLEQKGGTWHFNGVPYTGRYIDYYNSGQIWNEGTMVQGKLDGPFVVYYPNGNKKSLAHYKEGVLHGTWNDYYPNGVLMQSRDFSAGKTSEARKEYFINGQLQFERRLKNDTPYDTAVAYYSTGKVKKMTLFRDGVLVYDKRWEDLRIYTNDFFRGLNDGDLKEANKAYYKIWILDSASADTYFKGGLLMMKEFRFEEAVSEFNKALVVEPLLADAFLYRALARIKKQKFAAVKPATRNFKEPSLTLSDLTSLSPDEQQRICDDVQQALSLGFGEDNARKIIPGLILSHCQKGSIF